MATNLAPGSLPATKHIPSELLCMEDAAFDRAANYDTALRDVNLSVDRAGLTLVLLERGKTRLPLPDAAQGLISPSFGKVFYSGSSWTEASPRRAAALRGRMGRMSDHEAWVTALPVGENIMLQQLFHTRRNRDDIRHEAERLARTFGLPGLPTDLPENISRRDLHASALIKTFLGDPELVILERPIVGGYRQGLRHLVNACGDVRRRGGGILWLTEDRAIFEDKGLSPTRRYKAVGVNLVALES